MEEISNFSLQKHEGPYEKWPQQTILYFDNVDTNIKVRGFIIEAQYKCEFGYLLIISQDCPFEESNDFILLNNKFEVIAKNELWALFGTYLLSAHWPIDKNTLRLHYCGENFYDMTVIKCSKSANSVSIDLKEFSEYKSDKKSMESIERKKQQEADLFSGKYD